MVQSGGDVLKWEAELVQQPSVEGEGEHVR